MKKPRIARLGNEKSQRFRLALNWGSGSLRFGYQFWPHRAINAVFPATGAHVFVNHRAALLASVFGHHAVFSSQRCPAAAAVALPDTVGVWHGFHALDYRLLGAGFSGGYEFKGHTGILPTGPPATSSSRLTQSTRNLHPIPSTAIFHAFKDQIRPMIVKLRPRYL